MPLFITYSQFLPFTVSTPTQKSEQMKFGASFGSPTVPWITRPSDTLNRRNVATGPSPFART